MADFCKQCSEELFGEDFKELANLLPAEQYSDTIGAIGICEGCEGMVFDINGKCVDHSCSKHKGDHVCSLMESKPQS